jgi:hypothetical protein
VATYFLINAVAVAGGQRLFPGALIDDAVFSVAALQAAGAELWASTNVPVAAAAARVSSLRRAQGIDDLVAERVMRSGVAQVAQTVQANQVVDEAAIAAMVAAQDWISETANFTVAARSNYDVDSSAGNITATFEAAPGVAPAAAHGFKWTTAAGHTFTLNAGAGQAIEQLDGSFGASFVFTVPAEEIGWFWEPATLHWRLI